MYTVRVSTLKNALRCRRRWFYSAVLNLEPRREVVEPPAPLVQGSFIHELLARHYAGQGLPEVTKLQIQLPTAESLELDPQSWAEQWMQHYLWSVEHQPLELLCDSYWKVREVETSFTVPFFEEARLTGTWDMVIQTPAPRQSGTSRTWLVEHKSVTAWPPEDGLGYDYQIGLYLWALRQCYENVVGVVLNLVHRKLPSPPQLLKSGKLSTNRSARLDQYTLDQAIAQGNFNPDDYEEFRNNLQPTVLVRRYLLTYPPQFQQVLMQEAASLVEQLASLQPPEPGEEFQPGLGLERSLQRECQYDCQYRTLCLAELHGVDRQTVLEAEYQVRTEEPHPQEDTDDVWSDF